MSDKEDLLELIKKLHVQQKIMREWANTVERRFAAIDKVFEELLGVIPRE